MRFGDCPPFEEKPTKVTKGESETGVELELGGGSRFPGRWEAYLVPPQDTGDPRECCGMANRWSLLCFPGFIIIIIIFFLKKLIFIGYS